MQIQETVVPDKAASRASLFAYADVGISRQGNLVDNLLRQGIVLREGSSGGLCAVCVEVIDSHIVGLGELYELMFRVFLLQRTFLHVESKRSDGVAHPHIAMAAMQGKAEEGFGEECRLDLGIIEHSEAKYVIIYLGMVELRHLDVGSTK